jgi:hypothetical protein
MAPGKATPLSGTQNRKLNQRKSGKEVHVLPEHPKFSRDTLSPWITTARRRSVVARSIRTCVVDPEGSKNSAELKMPASTARFNQFRLTHLCCLISPLGRMVIKFRRTPKCRQPWSQPIAQGWHCGPVLTPIGKHHVSHSHHVSYSGTPRLGCLPVASCSSGLRMVRLHP